MKNKCEDCLKLREAVAKNVELKLAYDYRLYSNACHAMKRQPLQYCEWLDWRK